MSILSFFHERRDLIANLVSRELKSRYKSSVLGLLWSLLTPLFMALIYVVFLQLLSRGVPVAQVIIGVFAWTFTVQSIQTGMESITANSNLVKKVFFPRVLLPLSTTVAALVNFLLSLLVQFPLVLILLLMKDMTLQWSSFLIVGVIAYQFVFNLSVSMLFASANVYYRDTQHLVAIFLSAWFFLSPAMYHIGFVEDVARDMPWVLNVYMLNPMACIITLYRSLIMPDVSIIWTPWVAAGFIWPLLLVPAAIMVFKRSQRNFADML